MPKVSKQRARLRTIAKRGDGRKSNGAIKGRVYHADGIDAAVPLSFDGDVPAVSYRRKSTERFTPTTTPLSRRRSAPGGSSSSSASGGGGGAQTPAASSSARCRS